MRLRRVLPLLVAVALAVAVGACAKSPCSAPKAELANLTFSLKDMAGKDVKLADFKGKPLILNFWATWCGPCKEEIPTLVELVEKYKSRQLTVLGISIDDKAEELKKFAAEYKMNYPVLVGLGHDDLLEAYDASVAVPITWVVHPCGAVTGKHTGIWTKAEFETQLKAVF